MKKIYCILIITILLPLNVLAQQGWNSIHNFENETDCLVFKDSLTGFVGARSAIYKTTDGGLTWNDLNLNGLNNAVLDMILIDNNIIIGVGEEGIVIKTSDGGDTWSIRNIDSQNIYQTCYAGDSTVLAWTYNPEEYKSTIYRSTDLGETWGIKNIENFDLATIGFSSPQVGFGTTFYGNRIKTTDGGETWFSVTPIDIFRLGGSFRKTTFIDTNTGYMLDESGIIKTTDGGETWAAKYTTNNGSGLQDINTSGENIVWVAGGGSILKSTDAGESWIHQAFSPYHYLMSVSCIDSLICFALSPDRIIYKTTDGGGNTANEGSFFPLKIGNYWQFKSTRVYYNNKIDTLISYENMEVTGDTLFANIVKSYYVVKASYFSFHTNTIRYLRFDSLNSSIIENSFGEEYILFKLNASKNECWDRTCYSGLDTANIFGEEKLYKAYGHGDIPSWECSLAKDIGPFTMFDDEDWTVPDHSQYNLTYAKIDGKEYGAFVTAVEANKNYPNAYSLSQNYPNPFNPTTKIKYSIPHTSFVTLKVYDLLGREVTTIVNEEKPAGGYEVEFSAAGGGSNLSSGVYFYKLEAGGYVATKKLLLLK